MVDKRKLGWNPTYFGEPKKGSLAAVIAGITTKQNALVGDKPEVASSVAIEAQKEAKKLSKEDRYTVSIETNKNDKSDDGEGLDAVQPKAVKKKFKDRKDKDIDNDGDVDSSDKFLHKRRKAISKAVAKDDEKDEGNAFTKALKAARDNGDKTFVVSGKKFKVEDHDDEEPEDEGDEDEKDPKKNGKNGIKVHGEQYSKEDGEKFERTKEFKVSSMAKTLADMWKKHKPVA